MNNECYIFWFNLCSNCAVVVLWHCYLQHCILFHRCSTQGLWTWHSCFIWVSIVLRQDIGEVLLACSLGAHVCEGPSSFCEAKRPPTCSRVYYLTMQTKCTKYFGQLNCVSWPFDYMQLRAHTEYGQTAEELSSIIECHFLFMHPFQVKRAGRFSTVEQ